MEKTRKLTKIDYIIMFTLTFLYAFLAFYHLGSLENPNTFASDTSIIIDLAKEQEISKIRYFTGHEMGKVTLSYATDNQEYTVFKNLQDIPVFTWNDLEINQSFRYLKIEIDDKSHLGEIAFYKKNGERISVKESEENKLLLDEQSVVPKEISFENSTYFDEIYFARTAYEYAYQLPAYEWVHPPLGKVFISIPIRLFKMAPFYYRLMPTLAGILMIPVLYILAKRMFQKTKYAFLASLLLAADGFHFAHTRMASVDAFLVLFLLLSFLFMYEYLVSKKEIPLSKRLTKLFLSGLFIGCAIATKWTAFFGALALAIFFFLHFFQNYREKKAFKKEGYKILLWCVLFFVLIPLTIYISLYLCFPNMYYFQTGSLSKITNITQQMYAYHASLKADHPFYSSWYTWPLMLKPVWYYAGSVGNLKSTISGFGNPIVWWLGTLSMFYMLYKSIKKDKKAIFITGTYICLLISYVGITRGMFLYHYFPALPFTILAATYLIKDMTEKIHKNYLYIGVIIMVVFFFYYFFPVVSGMPVNKDRIDATKWLTTWIY